MNILFVHQNFPAQFVHVARALSNAAGVTARALVPEGHARSSSIPRTTYRFRLASVRTGEPLAQHFAERAARGAAVASAARQLAANGLRPDVVVGHGGWGETLFLRDVWPGVRIVLHAEFFYAADGRDAGFDPQTLGPLSFEARLRLRARNAAMVSAVVDADVAVAPTRWQADSFPAALRPAIKVLHEGVDTQFVRPDPGARLTLGREGVVIAPGDEVVTFVARNLEPYRGFHVFMRALPAILARRPGARAVIVGGDGSSYSAGPPGGGSWKDLFVSEVQGRLDLSRVHFVGRVPYPRFLRLMQISAAHVYLTYPFVLSWSLLEAMAAGAVVIGSATAPVQEVITDGVNGLLCPFSDADAIAGAVCKVLESPAHYAPMRLAARQTILDRYDLRTHCLPAWLRLISPATDR